MTNPVSGLTSVFKSEPALVTSVIGVVIGLAASVGFHLDVDQVKAIFGAVTLIVGILIRARVTPVKNDTDGAVAPHPDPVPQNLETPVIGHAGLPPQGA